MIEITDNNDVINEFYNLIEQDLPGMPKGCFVIVEPVIVKLHKQGKRESSSQKKNSKAKRKGKSEAQLIGHLKSWCLSLKLLYRSKYSTNSLAALINFANFDKMICTLT